MTVLVNGLQVYSGSFQNYNVLWNALLRATTGAEYQKTRIVLQNSLDQTTCAANITSQLFCVNDWLGFFQAEPYIVDTSVLGDIEIQIQLSSTGVLNISADGAGVNYSLASMYFLIDVVSFLDPLYDEMMAAKLGSGEVLEIPYQNVFTFSNAANASIRFALNSQCVNMLLAVNRADTYATLAVASASGTSNYFTFTVGNATNYQWQVDNVYMPSYPIVCANTTPLQYQYVKQAFGDHNNVLGFDNLIQSYANRYSQPITLANCRTAISEIGRAHV